jgi:hypothetical protein
LAVFVRKRGRLERFKVAFQAVRLPLRTDARFAAIRDLRRFTRMGVLAELQNAFAAVLDSSFIRYAGLIDAPCDRIGAASYIPEISCQTNIKSIIAPRPRKSSKIRELFGHISAIFQPFSHGSIFRVFTFCASTFCGSVVWVSGEVKMRGALGRGAKSKTAKSVPND